ncbi:hypothetical protein HZS_2985 [Henneguya salminicola]|nr:hypothetical protein HZS_2985 [Henneguya salminicola]
MFLQYHTNNITLEPYQTLNFNDIKGIYFSYGYHRTNSHYFINLNNMYVYLASNSYKIYSKDVQKDVDVKIKG